MKGKMGSPDKPLSDREGAVASGDSLPAHSKYPTVRHSDEAWRRIEARLKAENAELRDVLEAIVTKCGGAYIGFLYSELVRARAALARRAPEPDREGVTSRD